MLSLFHRLHVPSRSPYTHALTRFSQALTALFYTGLLLYSYFNSGWWLDIKLPMEVGSIAISLTFLYTGFFLLRRPFDFSSPQQIRTLFPAGTRGYAAIVYALTCIELGISILWVATAVTMCFNKGKDFKLLFERPPYGPWVGGIVLTGVECLLFIWSTYMIWRERLISGRRTRLRSLELSEDDTATAYARV